MLKQVWKVEATGQVFEDKNIALLACLLSSPRADKIMFKDKAILLDMIPKYFNLSPKEELFKLAGMSSIKKTNDSTKLGASSIGEAKLITQGLAEIKATKEAYNLINWVD